MLSKFCALSMFLLNQRFCIFSMFYMLSTNFTVLNISIFSMFPAKSKFSMLSVFYEVLTNCAVLTVYNKSMFCILSTVLYIFNVLSDFHGLLCLQSFFANSMFLYIFNELFFMLLRIYAVLRFVLNSMFCLVPIFYINFKVCANLKFFYACKVIY